MQATQAMPVTQAMLATQATPVTLKKAAAVAAEKLAAVAEEAEKLAAAAVAQLKLAEAEEAAAKVNNADIHSSHPQTPIIFQKADPKRGSAF